MIEFTGVFYCYKFCRGKNVSSKIYWGLCNSHYCFFLFWNWFFDEPSDHDILITVLTGFFALAVVGGIIEDEYIADKQEEFTTYLITAIVTTGFWVYQFYDTYSDFAGIEKNQILVAIGSVMHSWDNLLMAAVTFFTIMAKSKK